MKILKKGCIILIAVAFAFNFSNAQSNQPNMFVVHTDHVDFNMIPQYEEVAKQMHSEMKKHEIGSTYTAISVEDGRYVYVSPISSMADLDKNPVAGLVDKMGKESAKKMFDKMDKCYSSHYDYVLHHLADLSYMPEGYSTAGKDSREYHFIYYSPKNAEAMKNAIANVKKMFKDKGIKNGYNVYHSGFGATENYYMVEVAGEDSASIAMGGKENSKLMGDDGNNVMFGVISLASKYDQVEAEVRPDLSYAPAQN